MLFYLIFILCVFEFTRGIDIKIKNKFECGKSKNRLINSTDTHRSFPGESPWHVGIYKYNGERFDNICCGSIISTHIILTAASCVFDESKRAPLSPIGFKVVAGKITYDWDDADRNAQEMNVMSIHIMESFLGDIKSYSQNIALIGLSNKLEFNEFVSPVCIDWSNIEVDLEMNYISASGWGFGTDYSSILRQVTLPFLNIRQCGRQYSSARYRRFINHDKFCVVTNEGRQDKDTGSGVIFQNRDISYIHGVISVNIASEFSVATNVSKYINWLKETISKIDSEDRCDGFRCHDGNCIKDVFRCDGGEDCQDKSDESKMECGTTETSNSKGSCLLPKQKSGVSYTSVDCETDQCELKPHSFVKPNEEITLNCGMGYAPKDENSPNFLCRTGGTWYPEDPQCIKMCPPLKKDNVMIYCEYNGKKADCKNYARPMTKLKYNCQNFYKTKDHFAFNGYTECFESGQWGENLPTCIPECGIVNRHSDVKPTISGGKIAQYGKYPWHVGIYQIFSNNSYVNICGGSLIHPHMVLTAAHCFFDQTSGKQVDPSNIGVAGGKYKRDWYNHEENQQSLNVKDIVISEFYAGRDSRYEHDIAIINLSDSFFLNDFILPVCLDWENRGIYPRNAQGTIVGWGQTENNIYSENLKEIHMPYLTRHECWDKFKEYKQFITTDKFCVVYKEGAGAQYGDSGGGMTFTRDEIHFIHGVVSIKTGTNVFSALTNVTSHLSWIRNTLLKFTRLKLI